MFRKTPSDKNPGNLFIEIKKEFGSLHEKGREIMNNLTVRYPRHCFVVLVLALAISASLAYVVPPFDLAKPPAESHFLEEVKEFRSGMADEVSALFKIGNEAKRMGKLKSAIEQIIAKEKIDLQDSLFLEKAILELEKYHQTNPHSHAD